MGQDVDLRANAYFPLSDGQTYATPNTGQSNPYLAGSGVLYDTNGTLVEKPQGGFDIELGYRLPVFEGHVDSVRAYAGIYRFAATGTDTVQGGRARIAADVTPWLQVGARVQHDGERGSQGFVEATFRLPGKASFRKEGLRSRLDESPERDIDIVTSAKVTDTGIGKPVLNQDTGAAQRIIHVDNTNATAGDGSADSPYATLKAAEAALQPYDVVYVHRGDGATTGQDQGIIIDKPGVKLIGSGVDLVLSGNNVTGAAHGTAAQSTVIQPATAAPVITNNNLNAGNGNGIFVIQDDNSISGLTIQNAQRHGVRVESSSSAGAINTATISDLTVLSSQASGIAGIASSGGYIGTLTISNVTSNNTTGNGISIQTSNGGLIESLKINNAVTQGNSVAGIYILSQSNAAINNAEVNNATITGNANTGLRIEANGANAVIGNTVASNITESGSSQQGIWGIAQAGGQIGSINLREVAAHNNALQGVRITAQTSSQIGTVTLSDVTAYSNTQHGVRIDSSNSLISNADIQNIITYDNTLYGLYVQASAAGRITQTDIQNVNSYSNRSDGVRIEAAGVNSLISSAHVSNITSRNNTTAAGRGMLIYANTSGQIADVSLDDIEATGNAQQGIWVYTNNAQVGTLTFNKITASQNSGTGVNFLAENDGDIGASSWDDITTEGNASNGVGLQATGNGSTIGAASVSHLTTRDNTGSAGRGILINGVASGVVGTVTLSHVLAENNSQYGIYLLGQTAGSLSALLNHVTATGNTLNGVYVDDDTTGTFTADLGGGTLGSTGGNRIYGNTGTDLRVDLDGGDLKAESNWWGNAAGLLPGRVTLDAGGNTVDAVPFLGTDPGL